MKILVVDDAPDTRDTMKMLLEIQGHHVEVASNGKEAVECASDQLPDLVLMDLTMPVMDGLSATRQLRHLPKTETMPIVAVSAYLRDGAWRDRALAAGCNDCLSKPVDFGALDQVLSRFDPPH
ncbi:MAG: two-component system, cell cycle response regulator DivK [Betaproteobacteria bacterium]|jgi:CheY-like chemotaxis protein